VAATYYAVRFAARPSGKLAAMAAIALGLAMSCKFTVVLLAPPVLLLIVIRAARRARVGSGMGGPPMSRRDSGSSNGPTGGPPVPLVAPVATLEYRQKRSADPKGWLAFCRAALHRLPRFRYFIAIPAIAFITLWATYLFNIGRLEDQHLFDEEKTWNRIPESIKAARIPMPAMPLGLMFMAALGKTGFPCYFNGQVDLKGHLAYFPEAIALKTPSGAVIAFALAIAACGFARRKNRHPMIALCILLPPSLLMLTAMTGKLQIGIRHILPVLPFVYLFAVFYLQRGRWIYALVPLILLSTIESARAHPDYLPFFNTLAGGSQNGQKYLADSNLDWGQDMARLAAYIKQSGRTDYTIKVSGVRVADLTQFLGLDPASRDRDVEELARHPHGLLALGINAKLRLEEFKKEKDGSAKLGPDFGWVSGYPLVARIGQSIEVYDLDRH